MTLVGVEGPTSGDERSGRGTLAGRQVRHDAGEFDAAPETTKGATRSVAPFAFAEEKGQLFVVSVVLS